MKGDFSRWTFKPEKHYHGVLKQQGRVDLDSDWNEAEAIAAYRLDTETLDIIGNVGAPAGDAGFIISGGQSLTISKGRAYIGGLQCSNEQDALPLAQQPDLPHFKLPAIPGMYVAYLKAWLRHVTALDDPSIREDALGGPDTCSRSKVVWQVNLVQPGKLASLDCDTSFPEWDALTAQSTGMLAARAEPDPTSSDPCMIPAKAGYRRLENQLYRVEIHNGSASGAVTFKWSRDNGSVVTSWIAQNNLTLTVSSLGRDDQLGFDVGQWVELLDDTSELTGQPGTLAKVASVGDNTIVLESGSATGSYNIADFPLKPKIRRWDSTGLMAVKSGAWQPLEDGVEVQFSAGTYTTGDYWMIPARTLKADVEWPEDSAANPVPQPPIGIRVQYAKLAVLVFDGAKWTVMKSCLPLFPPLTGVAGAPSTRLGIHVINVGTLGHSTSLANDSDVPLAMLAAGIVVNCDSQLAPHSISRATCQVSVEMPVMVAGSLTGTQVPVGFTPLILSANVGVSADRKSIEWRAADANVFTYLQTSLTLLQSAKLDPRLLVRLRLFGQFIWGPEDTAPRAYLDGKAFGIGVADPSGTIHTRLQLPSGDGTPGGMFESWFWLTLPVTVVSVVFPTPQIIAGQTAQGTVNLSGPAPADGAIVGLVASNPKIGTVPSSLTIAPGATSGTFQVTQTSNSPGASQDLFQVTATLDLSQAKGSLTIIQKPPS
jgi:hypothetical protein